jgi:hypothetical protein
MKTAKEFYIEQREKGLTDHITCNRDPDYTLSFYQEIFKLMEDYHQQSKAIDLRDELIKFAQQFYADEETCIHNIYQYLKSK